MGNNSEAGAVTLQLRAAAESLMLLHFAILICPRQNSARQKEALSEGQVIIAEGLPHPQD